MALQGDQGLCESQSQHIDRTRRRQVGEVGPPEDEPRAEQQLDDPGPDCEGSYGCRRSDYRHRDEKPPQPCSEVLVAARCRQTGEPRKQRGLDSLAQEEWDARYYKPCQESSC